MQDRQVRSLATGIAIGGLLAAATMFLAGPAKADGYLDDAESDYAQRHVGAICSTLADYPSVEGVVGTTLAVADHTGWDIGSAVDVMNAAVWAGCPRLWPLMLATGEAARNQQGIFGPGGLA